MNRFAKRFLAHTLILGMILPVLPSYVAHAEDGIPLDADYFPDENFGDYISENVDTNEDGNLSEEECLVVTELCPTDMSISDLTGIEYFPNLTTLDATDNRLTVLDTSRNTALEQLIVTSNQLKTLDIHQNSSLKLLICKGNQLEELDLTGNSALETVDCSVNPLKELDVTKNLKLKGLSCIGNQLSELDVSRNTLLESLSCSENNLTELDVSANTNLDYLGFFENQLTELDISHNTKLTRLNCAANQLTALDVSHNPAMESLICLENRLTELILDQNPELDYLDCGSNLLTELDLSRNVKLSHVYCSGNDIQLIDLRNLEGKYSDSFEFETIVIKSDEDLGWQTVYTDTYYIIDNETTPKTCHLATGLMTIDGKKYLFDEDGILQTNVVIPAEITVNPSSVTMTTWDALKLEVKTEPEDVTVNDLDWKSGDESIVMVDKYGYLTPVAVGSTTVTVSSVYDRSVLYVIPVTIKPVITLETTEMELMSGESRQNMILENTDQIDEITREVDDPSVVTVSEGFVVQALDEGETYITLTVTDLIGDSEQFTIHVTVSGSGTINTDISRIDLYYNGELISEDEISVYESDSMAFTAVIYTTDNESYEYSFDQPVIQTEHGRINLNWTSSNSAVATVTRGNVEIGSAGRVFISAQAVGSDIMSDVAEVVVKPQPKMLQRLTIGSPVLLEIGRQERLICKFTPMNADNKKVYWESDDPDVVEVNAYGMVTAKSSGTTTIHVIAEENEEVEARVEVKVVSSLVKDIRISRGSAAQFGGKMIFREQEEFTGDAVLTLNHNAVTEVYIRTTVNEDAELKDLIFLIDDPDEIGLGAEDVTDDFTGLSDTEQIFCIQAEEIGEATVSFYAEGGDAAVRSLRVRVIPYDEWYSDENGDTWHFTNDVMDIGLTKIDGSTFFFNEDGILQTGWQNVNNKKYRFGTDGRMLTGWQTVDKKKYYFGTDGVMRTGWQKVGKSWYHFGTDGVMKTNWQKVGKVWYYFGTDGVMRTGWQKVGKVWYYFGTDGIMRTGWKKIGQVWYYFGTNGIMVSGWKKIGKAWYFFKSGAMVTGWQKIGKFWYFFKDGAMKSGWLKSGGNWYYFNADGEMVSGSRKIGSKVYNFSSSGVCLNP